MQIADWLQKLGMSEYAQRFAENRIDLSVLPDLTDQDLEKMGVVLGDRRKILRAISLIASEPPAVRQATAADDRSRHDTAERRQLTVMFADLVGSTALSTRLDAEDLREIIAGYHRCCKELVKHNGGFVAKYIGDGVLAYFGYPVAHEHDAERAVRAALALVEAVSFCHELRPVVRMASSQRHSEWVSKALRKHRQSMCKGASNNYNSNESECEISVNIDQVMRQRRVRTRFGARARLDGAYGVLERQVIGGLCPKGKSQLTLSESD